MRTERSILYDVFRQIQILNANKDSDISWLCSNTMNLMSNPTPPKPQHGREPDKVKPLAQYLDEYIERETNGGKVSQEIGNLWRHYDSWCELLEQALDAYESTEQVKIRIERRYETL